MKLSPKIIPEPLKVFIVKENHIGSAVSKLHYRQTSCYFCIKIKLEGEEGGGLKVDTFKFIYFLEDFFLIKVDFSMGDFSGKGGGTLLHSGYKLSLDL